MRALAAAAVPPSMVSSCSVSIQEIESDSPVVYPAHLLES